MRDKLLGVTLALGGLLISSCGSDSEFHALGPGAGSGGTGGETGSGNAAGTGGSSGGVSGMVGSAAGVTGSDPGNSDGGFSTNSGDADKCRVWPAPTPPPGVAVDAVCTSTDPSVSSPDFCYPLVNPQNDSNTLFTVGLYCGRGLWQVTGAQTVKVVSGVATVGPVMVPSNGTVGGTEATLTLANPPQDGDTVTLEVDSTIQCAGGPRTIVTTMILAYCGGEQLWVGGSESGSCDECPFRGAIPTT